MPRLLVCLLLCSTMAAHAADTFHFRAAPGPHAVGVNVVQQYDRSRLYKTAVDPYTGEPARGERARPLQAIVWYPADAGGRRQTFRDYLETGPTEDDFARGSAEVKRLTDAMIEEGAGTRRAALLRDLSRTMLAVRDAPARKGSFPVVIYAPGFSGSAVENADLCEYLASHGYIVLSSASLGEHRRTPTLTVEGLETQARDISWLIGHASALPQADTTRVAVVGFSWGGLSNVVAAARDPRIKALVSLDGSLDGYSELVDGGKDAARNVTPARVAVPLLFLGSRPAAAAGAGREGKGQRYSFMHEMKYSDVTILSLMPMRHHDFASSNQRFAQDEAFDRYSRDEVAQAYGWVARYTRRFLDAWLKDDAAWRSFISNTPAANGAPAGMLTAEVRRRKENAPPGWEGFVARLADVGFDQAVPLYEQFVKEGATFRLEQNDIIGWADYLKQRERFAQAREVYRLGDHLKPSLGAKFALAEMQRKTGQVDAAAHTYRKILALDPGNIHAQRYLKQSTRPPGVAAP